jgi:hypothetical protein
VLAAPAHATTHSVRRALRARCPGRDSLEFTRVIVG